MENNNFDKVIMVLLVSVILALLGTVYMMANRSPLPKATTTTALTPVVEKNVPTAPKETMADTTDWLTYSDEVSGFSFMYPKTVLLNSKVKNPTQLVLNVNIDKLSDIPEDLPMMMGRSDALLEKARLIKGEGDSLIKLGTTYGQTSTTLSQFEVCSVMFLKKITFYPGEYRVNISLLGPKSKIVAEMPAYFAVDKANCGVDKIWNQEKLNEFESVLVKKNGAGMAQEWFDTFGEITKTIKLGNPTPPVVKGTTYKNSTYGFEITYPVNYRLLTDKDNLSGYSNGVALLYTGGQAYDIVIEVWDSELEYQSHYASRISSLTVLKSHNKFVTFFDNTGTSGNKQTISTAKLI